MVGVSCPVFAVRNACRRPEETITMNDILFIGITVAFFALSAVYAVFCEKIR